MAKPKLKTERGKQFVSQNKDSLGLRMLAFSRE